MRDPFADEYYNRLYYSDPIARALAEYRLKTYQYGGNSFVMSNGNIGTVFAKKLDGTWGTKQRTHRDRSIVERVLFNDPATIVFWKDGTKTVVKKQDGDIYDAEKGFMAAYLKKMLGNDNQYNWEIKHFVPRQGPQSNMTILVEVDTSGLSEEEIELFKQGFKLTNLRVIERSDESIIEDTADDSVEFNAASEIQVDSENSAINFPGFCESVEYAMDADSL